MFYRIVQLSGYLQDSIGTHCLYALPLLPAVLAVYFFILFRRGDSGR